MNREQQSNCSEDKFNRRVSSHMHSDIELHTITDYKEIHLWLFFSTLGFWDACVPELDCEVTIWTYAESTFEVYIVKLSHINY